jgi:hypothetical protein
MSAVDTIRMLGEGLVIADAEEWRRIQARIAWVREATAALRDAHRRMTDRCCAAVDRVSEQDFNRLFEAEQAKVDAIRAPLQAVIDRDEWPAHLYFGCI